MSVKTVKHIGIDVTVQTILPLVKNAKIPATLHLDHCQDPDFAKKYIDAGFPSVMIDASFTEFAASMEISKIKSYKKLTEVLCKNNINVSWNMVLYNNGTALAPNRVQRKHIFEAIARAGYTEDWRKAKLMVRDNPDLNVKRDKIDPVEAIKLIHKTGGFAS